MRKCGMCSACCRWPSVAEIDKPAREPCRFLHRRGFRCTIYSDRPKMCADYRCSWIRGIGAVKDRPDTSDILIDRRMTKWGYCLVAKQLKLGAAMTAKGGHTLKRAGRDSGMLVLVVDFDDSDLVIGAAGPSNLVEDFQKETCGLQVPVGTFSHYVDDIVEKAGEGIWPGM